MTDLQYRFLVSYIADGFPPRATLSKEDQALRRTCKEAKFFRTAIDDTGNWFTTLSDVGRAAMLEHEQQLEREARENAQREAKQRARDQATQERWRQDARRSWLQFGLNALFGLIGFIGGLIVEHHAGLLEALLSLFHG